MVLPNISASDPVEEQASTQRSRELAEQQAALAEQQQTSTSTSTTPGEDPEAELQRIREEQARRQAEAEEAESQLSDEEIEKRNRLTLLAASQLARSGETDASAGTIRITREEFERRKNSPILQAEIERAKRENRRELPSALGVPVRNRDFDAREARLKELEKSNDPRVRQAAKIGLDLEELREKGRIATEDVGSDVQIQGALDQRGKKTLPRVAVDTAGDIGLSLIPIFGTARDARRIANNWDEASNAERALDTGLLGVSAIGDALTVLGVGVFIKGAATGARTAATTTKVITATADKAEDLSTIARASKATQRSISRFEVSAVPDPKLADEAAKLAKQFPKKRFDVIIDEPSTVAIKSSAKIDDSIRAAKDTSKRSRFVLELDAPTLNTRRINKIATELADVAQGKPTPLVRGGRELPTENATVLIRRVNRASSEQAIQAQAVETARLAKLIGDDRSFNEIRKKALKELRKKARESGERDLQEASEEIAKRLRSRGVKVEFEDIDFDSADQITVKLGDKLSDREITKLAQELEVQAGRVPTPLAKGSKRLPTEGREIVIDQTRRGAAINETRKKLIAALKRRKLKVSRQKEERVLRLQPDDSAQRGALGGGKSGSGRGGLAVLEKPKTRPAGGARVRQTRSRVRRATGRRGRGRRIPASAPVPDREREAGEAGDPDITPEDVDEPVNVDDPSVEPDPTPDPVPNFVPQPDQPEDDPTRTTVGTTSKSTSKAKGDQVKIVKAAPDLQTKDGKQLFPVVFNWRQGRFFKQHDIRTGKTRTFKRVPTGGIQSGRTPQETLKPVGFDDDKPGKSRFPISSKVAALIDNRRISFTGRRNKLGE